MFYSEVGLHLTDRNLIGRNNSINHSWPSNSWKRARTDTDSNYNIGYYTVVTVNLEFLILVPDNVSMVKHTNSHFALYPEQVIQVMKSGIRDIMYSQR